MKQYSIHLRYKDGEDIAEYYGYVVAITWIRAKRTVHLLYSDMNDDDISEVTFLSVNDEVIMEDAG